MCQIFMAHPQRQIFPLLGTLIELLMDRFIELNCDSVEEMFTASELHLISPEIISIENENPFEGTVTTTQNILEDLLEK
jgi:hypothetical protein